MEKEEGTILETGSEFCSVDKLDKLFKYHPNWSKMECIISKGVKYKIEDLPKCLRKEDLDYMIERGNHKSSMNPSIHPTLLETKK